MPVLDGWRGVAVTTIVAYHLLIPSNLLNRLPDTTAVQMFTGAMPRMIDVLFIVSGFVLFMPTMARGGNFGNPATYAVRRAARILPTYYLAVGLVVALIYLYPSLGIPDPTAFEVGVHLTLMQSVVQLIEPSFRMGLGLDGALWTISALMTFYIMLPFIANAYYRHPFRGLAAAALVTLVWRFVMTDVIKPALELRGHGQLPFWMYHVALGMTAAWLWWQMHENPALEARARRLARWAVAGSALGLLVVLVLSPLNPPSTKPLEAIARADSSTVIAIAFPTLLTVLMFATALAPPRWRFGLDSTPARRLGDASYGIYMVHLPILLVVLSTGLIPRTGAAAAIAAWYAVVIGLSTLFGWLAFRWIEVPIRDRAREWAKRHEGSQPGSPRPPALDETPIGILSR